MRIASLGMYDFAFTANALDRLWAAVARRLESLGVVSVPMALERHLPLFEIWRSPDLLLGQTCGYPLIHGHAGEARLVATPVFAWPGCDGPDHKSFIVVREDDPAADLVALRGRVAAINGWDSNTGMNLLRATLAPLAADGRFLSAVVVTGSHYGSAAAVRDGRADLAAIDCVSAGIARAQAPDLLAGLRVIAETPSTPALPFITRADAGDEEVALLAGALESALADPALTPARNVLGLRGVARLPRTAYDRVAELEREAAAQGYPELR